MMQQIQKGCDLPLADRAHATDTTFELDMPREMPAAGHSSLLNLPYDIRMHIWLYILRPGYVRHWCDMDTDEVCQHKQHESQPSFLGCTNLLQTCSRVYHEGIELLHWKLATIELDGRYNRLLRDPLEFGKPGYFQSMKATTKWYLPRTYDALEIIRMRRIQLDIVLPAIRAGQPPDSMGHRLSLAPVMKNLKEVSQALAKSDSLRFVRITIRRLPGDMMWGGTEDETHIGADATDTEHDVSPQAEHPDTLAALKGIIDAAAKIGSFLEVKADELLPDSDIPAEQLASDLLRTAQDAGVEAKFTPKPLPDLPTPSGGIPGSDWDHAVPFADTTDDDLASNFNSLDLIEDQLLTGYGPPSLGEPAPADHKEDCGPLTYTPKRRYELVPECRLCYALFASWAGLASHLDQKPEHRRPFRTKTFNQLDRYAFHGLGTRRCPTCARNFETLDGLTKHQKRLRHGRMGIIPKYREDNARWHRRWKKHHDRHGWA